MANTLAQLIIGGSLASTEIAGEADDKGRSAAELQPELQPSDP